MTMLKRKSDLISEIMKKAYLVNTNTEKNLKEIIADTAISAKDNII